MASIVQRLARWARGLSHGDLPPSVSRSAHLQMLSVSGAIRGVCDRPLARSLRAMGAQGSAPLVGGNRLAPRDAIRYHAGLSVWLDHDDYLFMGHTGHGAAAGAWISAGDRTVGELITAVVAANEVAGRIGASLLLGPSNGQGWAAVSAAATAISAGLVEGLDEDQLAQALALALSTPHHIPFQTLLAGGQAKALVAAAPAVQGYDAVCLAKAGVTGPLDILDTRDGLLGTLSWAPLRNAFTGLGKAWLTETLAYKLMPGCAYVHPPVQAVGEILRRHVKAADKRLRVDQISRIEVRTGAPGWMLEQHVSAHGGYCPSTIPFSIGRSIGVLVVAHELGPAQLEPTWLAENHDRIADVASKVEVIHDWGATTRLIHHVADVAAPLLTGLRLSELSQVLAMAESAGPVVRPPLGLGAVFALGRIRPAALFERLKYSSGDLADADLRQWQFLFSSDVRVYTTRGGSWPEQRTVPEGSPGWPWEATVEGVHSKFAAGHPELVELARALSARSASTDAGSWLADLLR